MKTPLLRRSRALTASSPSRNSAIARRSRCGEPAKTKVERPSLSATVSVSVNLMSSNDLASVKSVVLKMPGPVRFT
jgi:hypothetical protein